MKTYSKNVIKVLRLIQNSKEGRVTPVQYLKAKSKSDHPMITAGSVANVMGYFGRIAQEGLITRDRDVEENAFLLTPEGHWVLSMYDDGWKLVDGEWFNGDKKVKQRTMRLFAKTGKKPRI